MDDTFVFVYEGAACAAGDDPQTEKEKLRSRLADFKRSTEISSSLPPTFRRKFLSPESLMESPFASSYSGSSDVSNKECQFRGCRKRKKKPPLMKEFSSTSSTESSSDLDDNAHENAARMRKIELQKVTRRKKRKGNQTKYLTNDDTNDSVLSKNEVVINNNSFASNLPGLIPATNPLDETCPLYATNQNQPKEEDSENSFESETSEESDNDGFRQRLDLLNDLKDFWIETKQTSANMAVLLKKLQPHFPTLPVDPRTLFPVGEGASSFSMKNMPPGAYLHFGIRRGLESTLLKMNEVKSVIRIILHIDGVNVFKSAMKVFWPVLVAIEGIEGSTFIAGIYFGESKPEFVNMFLEDTISELQDLLDTGLFNGNSTAVQFSHCACDSIARAYIKNIKSPTGFYACDRCVQRGETVNKGRRFLDHSAQRRTDVHFRMKEQMEHHRGDSPFIRISNIDLVSDFPNDYMHSVCEGIVPKILEFLREAGGRFRLSSSCLSQMNSEIFESRKCVTNDFQRRPRSLNHLSKWKATEHRLFCLYFGHSIVSKYSPTIGLILRRLAIILRILCHPQWSKTLNDYCLRLTHFFLDNCRIHFGESFLTLTTHSLIHLVEDCRIRGSADNFSSFQFENFLQYVVGCVHSAYRPLEQMRTQVVRHGQQLGQKLRCVSSNQESKLKYPIDTDCVSGTLIGFNWHDFESFFRSVDFNRSQITGYGANRYVLCNEKVVMKVKYIGVRSADIYLIGRQLRCPVSAFTDPLESSILDIYQGTRFSFSYKCVALNEVKCKLLRHDDCFYPLLHTYTV